MSNRDLVFIDVRNIYFTYVFKTNESLTLNLHTYFLNITLTSISIHAYYVKSGYAEKLHFFLPVLCLALFN